MSNKIPFINLAAQQAKIKSELDRRIAAVLEHGQYILGAEVKELEEKLAAYVGVKHCIACASGTDALLIALMALGVKQGDEVVTTPFSYAATAEVIARLGATPIFADIDAKTYNIDPTKIENAITDKTKAIMPVSLYGQCADFDEINAIAAKYNLPVVEDGAQSFGATYKGRKSCGLSTIGCTSFFPSKPLGCYGDGGACFTDDDELAAKMDMIHRHGQNRRYHHVMMGINSRLDTLQAAILLAKFTIFEEEVRLREEIGAKYSEKLLGSGVVTPYIEPHNTSVYAQYTVQVDNRDALREKLTAAGVPTAVHYPITLNRQPMFSYLPQASENFPNADRIARHVVSLPMSAYLTDAEMDRVCECIL